MIETIGYLGGILLAWCGVPLLIEAIRTRKAPINGVFLFMWLSGEVLMLAYSLLAFGINWPLLINYLANIMIIVIVLGIKYGK